MKTVILAGGTGTRLAGETPGRDLGPGGPVLSLWPREPRPVRELARLLAKLVAVPADLRFGTHPRARPEPELLAADPSKLTKMGWRSRTALEPGLALTLAWYRDHAAV